MAYFRTSKTSPTIEAAAQGQHQPSRASKCRALFTPKSIHPAKLKPSAMIIDIEIIRRSNQVIAYAGF